jgi:hypothetical protein
MAAQLTDPYRPSEQELLDWASSKRFDLPQDWEVVVPLERGLHKLILALASDPACRRARKKTLLYMLYAITEQFGISRSEPEHMEMLVSAALASRDPATELWARRSSEVIKDPIKFHRKKWMNYARELST